MSYKFSDRSKRHLATLRPELQSLLEEAIKVRDFSLIAGHRPKEEQDHAFATGRSKLKWPESKHNTFPSEAFDAIPYPFTQADWEDRELWIGWSNWMVGFAAARGITLRSGYDWDRDFDHRDQRFMDGPHFEMVLPG